MKLKLLSWSICATAFALAGAASAQEGTWSAGAANTAVGTADSELWFYCVYIRLDQTEYLTDVFPGRANDRGAIAQAWKEYVNRNLPVDSMPHIACSSNEDRVLAEHYRSGRSNRKIPVDWPGAPQTEAAELVEVVEEAGVVAGSADVELSLPEATPVPEPVASSESVGAWQDPSAPAPPQDLAAVEEDVAAVLASREEEWQRMKAESDAQIAARQAAQLKYEQDLAAANAAREQWEKDKAANDAAVEAARLEHERYQRELAEHEAKYGKSAE